jgi:hypothetical protein
MRYNGESLTTGPAKLPVRRHVSPTGRAGLFELCAALLAEADLFAVLKLASRTLHTVASTNQAAKLETGASLLDKCWYIRSARQCNKIRKPEAIMKGYYVKEKNLATGRKPSIGNDVYIRRVGM